MTADSIVPDPTNLQQFNRYSYVLNNPIRYTDPTGHCPNYCPTDTSTGETISVNSGSIVSTSGGSSSGNTSGSTGGTTGGSTGGTTGGSEVEVTLDLGCFCWKSLDQYRTENPTDIFGQRWDGKSVSGEDGLTGDIVAQNTIDFVDVKSYLGSDGKYHTIAESPNGELYEVEPIPGSGGWNVKGRVESYDGLSSWHKALDSLNIQPIVGIKPEKGTSFRGGKKNNRDNWYGYNDKKFQRWWHRSGKRSFGGSDIQNADEAREAFEHWNDIGRPGVK